MEASIKTSEGLVDQAVCPWEGRAWSCDSKLKSSVETPGSWTSQECFSKTTRSEQSQPKIEVVRTTTTSSVIRMEPHKPFGIHLTSPQLAWDMKQWNLMFDLCFCVLLWSHWFLLPCSLFLNGNAYPVLYVLEVFNFILIFTAKSFILGLRADFALELFNNIVTVNILTIFRDDLNRFYTKRCAWVLGGLWWNVFHVHVPSQNFMFSEVGF